MKLISQSVSQYFCHVSLSLCLYVFLKLNLLWNELFVLFFITFELFVLKCIAFELKIELLNDKT